MQTIKILLLVIVTAGLPQNGACQSLFCYRCPQKHPRISENCTFSEAKVFACGTKGCLVGMHPDYSDEVRRYDCWNPAVNVAGCDSEPNELGYRRCLCNTDCCNTWVDPNDTKGPNLNGCNGTSSTITTSVSTTVSTIVTAAATTVTTTVTAAETTVTTAETTVTTTVTTAETTVTTTVTTAETTVTTTVPTVTTAETTVTTIAPTVTGMQTEETKSELVKSGVSGNKHCSALQLGAAKLSILILVILKSLF